MTTDPTLFRQLPSVDELLKLPAATRLGSRLAHPYLAGAARRLVETWREDLRQGRLDAAALASRLAQAEAEFEALVTADLTPLPRRLINATGVVVHTNLGRAPWPERAIARAMDAARGAVALEYDLASGERGTREALLAKARRLFPEVEEVLAVNNCAAAVLLALNSLAEGREVVISRGELVEIGGSFRIPDVLAKSGAVLREVGTTNRTRIEDYESAVSDKTALFLKVHPSNYRVVGFTETVANRELVALARRLNLMVVEDLGSGLMVDLGAHGVVDETTVAQALAAGVDFVTVSGDKLFGGPQAGLVLGRAAPLKRLRKNPLYRALRCDKVTLAALDACFEIYLAGDPLAEVPVLRAIAADPVLLERRAEALAARLRSLSGVEARAVPSVGTVGGGASPLARLEGHAVAVSVAGKSAAALEAGLRAATTPIVARVEDGRVLFDLRTVDEADEDLVVAAVRSQVHP